jgi:glycosyltransferase involved in cell wall biosynthesis
VASNARVRVLRIAGRLNIGGPSFHTILLTQLLDTGRYESMLAVGSVGAREGDMTDFATDRGVAPYEIPMMRREVRPLLDVVALWHLYRLMRRFRPTIVHTHAAKAGALGRIAAILARVPIVVHTYHGHVFHSYFGPFRTRAYLAVERLLARATDQVIAVGPLLRRDLAGYGFDRGNRLTTVLLGLDLQQFLAPDSDGVGLRRELGLGDGVLLVGIVARLVPVKDHVTFLAAAARVLGSGVRAHFLIVGDGDLRSDLELAAQRLGIAPHVSFLGWRHDLPSVYRALDIVALSSLNEGLPVAVIEAMASARPVVATDVGSVSDLVVAGKTGYVVPPRSPDELADAICALAAAPDRRAAMGLAARARAYPKYDISRLTADIDALYQRLLRGERN